MMMIEVLTVFMFLTQLATCQEFEKNVVPGKESPMEAGEDYTDYQYYDYYAGPDDSSQCPEDMSCPKVQECSTYDSCYWRGGDIEDFRCDPIHLYNVCCDRVVERWEKKEYGPDVCPADLSCSKAQECSTYDRCKWRGGTIEDLKCDPNRVYHVCCEPSGSFPGHFE